MNNPVNVCLSINEKWAPFAAVTIASIASNTSAEVLFFVLHTELKNETISKINSLTKKFCNVKLEYIEVNEEKMLAGFQSDISYVSVDTFSKFLFADLKEDIDKVIYTDVDVVFNGDIQDLFNEKLDGHTIGAVPGISHIDGKDNGRLKIDQSHIYFQAGLLLIDCNKWRDQKITSKLHNLTKENRIFRYGDQDLLNIVFENSYKPLDQKYCVIPWQLNDMQHFSEEAVEASKNPFIIHYCGGDKPWLRKTELDEYFWKYVELTEFKQEIQSIFWKHNFVSRECARHTNKYKLFKYILLIKINRKVYYDEITDRYFLFNFIPILKKIEKPDTTIWSTFFGIQVLRINKTI